MSELWERPLERKRAKSTGGRARSSANRARRSSPFLAMEELENRTLLSVTAVLNLSALDINLSAAGDQATITPSGSSIDVSGTGYSLHAFASVTSIARSRTLSRCRL